jgi:hypothetical protein
MTPEQFCYWLQGRAELQPDNPPSAEEWPMIVMHLQMVFRKVTPPLVGFSQPPKTAVQSIMQRAQEMQHGFIPPAQC